ncbi:leucine-rich repeat domain-containing protein [Zavarzinella formosa]|uniref:leucine-rich repeat domain-containing protein n=1 Tax=Zavarzinella formosa TaxID=360055 RepID=UPI00030B5B86|nr:hypothetical protein [Zavarzinella formosa]
MPRLSALVVVLLASQGMFADTPAEEQIRQWIRDLDHPRYRVRDVATLKLQQAGVPAVAALVGPAKHGNAEASDRAMKILGELAESKDEPTERAARNALRQLTSEPGSISSVARSILERRRNEYLARLEAYQASLTRHGDQLRSIQLEEVSEADILKLMPLLKEFPEIEELSARTKAFGDQAAKHLTLLPNLRDLNLFESSISDEGLKTIGKLQNLRSLPMGRTKITDAGLKHIAKLTELDYVGVRGNPITDEGVRNLKTLVNLSGMNLAETKVTDSGIAELKRFPKMRSLFLDNTAITDAALPELAKLKELEQATLMKTRTTFEGRSRLKEALPNLRITDEERDYP